MKMNYVTNVANPMHKIESKEYIKIAVDKDKRRDRVPDKSKRRVADDYVVKQALAAWGLVE